MHTAASSARRLWTVKEYQRMGDLGILPESGVELIDGEVREKNAWGTPRRWTYEDWERMLAGGIVDEDERLELVDGDLVCMTPVGDRHMYTVDLVAEYLWGQMRGRAIVRVQSPLKFHTGEAPVPDLVLLRMYEDRYRSRSAGPWDALLVVEVSDTSLARDLGKAEQYARAAIPEYWIVDVNRTAVLVHQQPVGANTRTSASTGTGGCSLPPRLEDARFEQRRCWALLELPSSCRPTVQVRACGVKRYTVDGPGGSR